MNFQGYERHHGEVGTRNLVAVLASVICSTTPVRKIADAVPGAVAVTHQFGCSQVGDDLIQTRRTLVGTAAHPNVRAVLVVGLGCETNEADEFAALIPKTKPIDVTGIQRLGGTDRVIEYGVEAVRRHVEEGQTEKRRTLPFSRLTIGVLSVDGDDETRSTVYPVMASLANDLVDRGNRVIVGLSPAMAPLAGKLLARAGSNAAKKQLRFLDEGLRRRRWLDVDGDWTHLRPWTEEERRQAERESPLLGDRPIASVLAYAEKPEEAGLHTMVVSSDPVEAMAGLVAGGAHLMIVVSRRGLLSGSLLAPTVVVTPEGHGDGILSELVDFRVRRGDPQGEAERLCRHLSAVASGEPTSLEKEGLLDFAISQIGTSY